MRPKAKYLRQAIDQPWNYNDEELKTLKDELAKTIYEKEYDQWFRRSSQGFSNEPAPTPPVTDVRSDTVHGIQDGSESKRHQL